MHNQITINQSATKSAIIELIAQYYSNILGEEVSAKFAGKLILAQVAFAVMVFPVEASILFRLFGVVAFGLSLLNCRSRD